MVPWIILLLPLVFAQPSALLLPGETPELYHILCEGRTYDAYVVGGKNPTLLVVAQDDNVILEQNTYYLVARTVLRYLALSDFAPRFLTRGAAAVMDNLASNLQLKAGDLEILARQLANVDVDISSELNSVASELRNAAKAAMKLSADLKDAADSFVLFLKAPKCEYNPDLTVFLEFYELRDTLLRINSDIQSLQTEFTELNLDPDLAAYVSRHLVPIPLDTVNEYYAYAQQEESFLNSVFSEDYEEELGILYDHLLSRMDLAEYHRALLEPLLDYPDLKSAYYAIIGQEGWKRQDLVYRARTLYAEMEQAASSGDYQLASRKANELRSVLSQIVKEGKEEQETQWTLWLVIGFILVLAVIFLVRRGKGEEEVSEPDIYASF